MTNPAPRPALRKAPDADVHPALAFGPSETIDLRASRRSPGAASATFHNPAAESIAAAVNQGPKPAKSGGKKHRAKAKKSETDVGAKPDTKKQAKKGKGSQRLHAQSKPAKVSKGGKVGQPASGKAESGKRSRVDVRLHVPGDVRRQLRSAAKARGTSVEDVVTSVLEGWRPS